MHLTGKLRLLLTLLIVLAFGAGTFVWFGFAKLNRALEEHHTSHQVVQGMFELSLLTNEVLHNHHPRSKKQWLTKHQTQSDLLNKLISRDHAEQIMIDDLKEDHGHLKGTFLDLTTHTTVSNDRKKLLTHQLSLQAQEMNVLSKELNGSCEARITRIRQASQQALWVLVFALTAVSFWVFFFMRNLVLKPLTTLWEGLTAFSNGDLKARIPPSGRHEIGALADKFNLQLQRMEERIRLQSAISQTMQGGTNLVDPKTLTMVYACPAFEKMFGYEPGELNGKPVSILNVNPQSKAPIQRTRTALETHGSFKGEFQNKRKDGSSFWTYAQISRKEIPPYGEVFIAVQEDITEQKMLLSEILNIANNEYQRLANELHDNLGQQLTGLAYKSHSMVEQSDQGHHPTTQDLQYMARNIDLVAQQVSQIARGFAYVGPDKESFLSILEDLTSNTSKIFNIKCQLAWSEALQVPERNKALNLIRIAQEAINNAVKHAKASEIRVTLKNEEDWFSLEIADNGVGLHENDDGPNGVGMKIMNYRANIMNGEMKIQSSPAHGTTITCEVAL